MAANAADPAATKKRLALAITDFLQTSLKDGTLQPEDQESIEVATSCIGDAFKVDPSDAAAVTAALGPGQNLLSIYGVYEKLKGKSTPSTTGASSAAEGEPSTPVSGGAAPGTSTAAGTSGDAEKLKQQGNAAMQRKDYDAAIALYTQAITLAPTNPIYLSNRAAAYSALRRHDEARSDAEMATAADPSYTKAWSRLGLARFALGDAKGSMEAYKSGIDAEGSGGSEAMRKGYETARRKVEEQGGQVGDDEADDVTAAPRGGAAGGMPDLGSLAGMFGGGGAGGGGMPDLGALMNNPMMRQMAQNLMSNPDAMNNLMNNPQLRNMANSMRGGGGGGEGGGAPDFSSLMNDPNIAQMAQQFMGGMGGGGGAGAGGAGRGGGA